MGRVMTQGVLYIWISEPGFHSFHILYKSIIDYHNSKVTHLL